MDNPEHARLCKMVTAPFTIRRDARPEERAAGHQALIGYLDRLVGEKLEHPAARERAPALVASAVEELLRYLNITHNGRGVRPSARARA